MSVNHFPYLPPIVTNPESNHYADGDPHLRQNLISCSLARCQPTFPENFMQIRSEVFAQSC